MASDIARIYPNFRPTLPRLPRLPDLLTTANLSCGVGSILLASQGQLTIACGLVFLAALFDVLDGLAARALGGGSEFGKQLDSLADMVSFGVAPGMVLWFLYERDSVLGWSLNSIINWFGDGPPGWVIPLAVIIIPAASAWRLAKFNIDQRQTIGFLGLPTPANALFWISIPLIVSGTLLNEGPGSKVLLDGFATVLAHPSLILGVSLVLAILMLSSLPLPSLKFKHYRWKGNEVIYCLLASATCLLLLYGVLAVPLILIIYLLSPLWGKLFPKPNN